MFQVDSSSDVNDISLEFPSTIASFIGSIDSINGCFQEFQSKSVQIPRMSVRLVVSAEDQNRNAPEEVKCLAAYIQTSEFVELFGEAPQVYSLNKKEFFISKAIENFDQFFDKQCCQAFELSFLIVDHSSAVVVSENAPVDGGLTSEFIGKDFILAPFRDYIVNVALTDTSVFARIVHLAQSSGTGKTRLCLELLFDLKCGWYCVYRQPNSSGLPKSSPWFEVLFEAFHKCRSDDEAVLLCLKFIKELLQLDLFSVPRPSPGAEACESALATARNVFLQNDGCDVNILSRVVSCISSKLQISVPVIATNNTSSNPTNPGSTSVSEIVTTSIETNAELQVAKKKLVREIKNLVASKYNNVSAIPLIFDECHELLVTPRMKPTNITLYRAMRRALIELRTLKLWPFFLVLNRF